MRVNWLLQSTISEALTASPLCGLRLLFDFVPEYLGVLAQGETDGAQLALKEEAASEVVILINSDRNLFII